MAPSGDIPEDAMVSALQKASIWDRISASGGLDADLDAVGLSHGQRQLFCLARATLKKSKILIMDEIMSGVDQETEDWMEKLIQRNFRNVLSSILHIG
jgi:ABC-type multidrug transport system fused ATPase/permease subunit